MVLRTDICIQAAGASDAWAARPDTLRKETSKSKKNKPMSGQACSHHSQGVRAEAGRERRSRAQGRKCSARVSYVKETGLQAAMHISGILSLSVTVVMESGQLLQLENYSPPPDSPG